MVRNWRTCVCKREEGRERATNGGSERGIEGERLNEERVRKDREKEIVQGKKEKEGEGERERAMASLRERGQGGWGGRARARARGRGRMEQYERVRGRYSER